MSGSSLGRLDWSLDRDQEGHRTYKLLSLVKTNDYSDGPTSVMLASGLPTIGSYWAFGNDSDPYAICWPTMSVQRWQPRPGEVGKHWTVEQTFSTRPLKRCQDNSIEDPLAEPPKISGGFARYMKRVEKDRFDKAILSSSLEQIIGVEKPDARPTVVIEQNLPYLDLAMFSEMVNGVNDSPMWGVAARCVMLTNVTWSRNVFGTCGFYFTRRLEFEINFDTHDLTEVLDKGYKCLRGSWQKIDGTPRWVTNAELDPTKASSYMYFKDYFSENTPTAILLKDGEFQDDPNDPRFLDTIEIAEQYNFFLLNVPSNLAA